MEKNKDINSPTFDWSYGHPKLERKGERKMANNQISPRDAFDHVAMVTTLAPMSLTDHQKTQVCVSILRQTFFSQPVNMKPKDRELGKIIEMAKGESDGKTDPTNDGR